MVHTDGHESHVYSPSAIWFANSELRQAFMNNHTRYLFMSSRMQSLSRPRGLGHRFFGVLHRDPLPRACLFASATHAAVRSWTARSCPKSARAAIQGDGRLQLGLIRRLYVAILKAWKTLLGFDMACFVSWVWNHMHARQSNVYSVRPHHEVYAERCRTICNSRVNSSLDHIIITTKKMTFVESNSEKNCTPRGTSVARCVYLGDAIC